MYDPISYSPPTSAPRGALFVVSNSPERVPAHRIKQERGATLVETGGAVGWIASSQLRPLPVDDDGMGGFPNGVEGGVEAECDPSGDPCDPLCFTTLPPGTPLFDAIDGHEVGHVPQHFQGPVVPQERGWSRVDVDTRFGKLVLWAGPRAPGPAAPTCPPDKMRVGAFPPPPPPPPPLPLISPTDLKALRAAGSPTIMPDPDTKAEIARSGKQRLTATFRVCITTSGDLRSLSLFNSSGFGSYDREIGATIRSQWRFRPPIVDGKPTDACARVTFHYPQDSPRP